MSQRFELGFDGSSYDLFRHLYRKNPASFFAYVNAGDHRVVSTSPERFMSMDGRYVETRPIKGTRPRGKTPDDDRKLAEGLLESPKDDAELSMIVDLLRNDIGKVCEAGSVNVREHKRLESYQNVYHLVSVVEGRLPPDAGAVDLIKAVFPGGSITGCPKIRAMEIIDELESHRRHVYTGSIGYISFHDTMDLSIAIRTATVVDDKIIFSVGGGIVYDSDPEEEYEETIHKGRTFMAAFAGNRGAAEPGEMAWVNGTLEPIENVTVPLMDLGVQYGFGFFETLRVDEGTPKFLDDHVKRFTDTWKRLLEGPPPVLTWREITDQVISANGLIEDIAVVKILVTAGTRRRTPYDRTLVVTARPYTHRLFGKSGEGLNLATYPEPRQSPLAEHKTLNYLYYYLAGEWAAGQGSDEALITNPDGSISETNTGNLILVKSTAVTLPESPHVLSGVMERAVCRQLLNWGYTAERARLTVKDLFAADDVLVTNSLLGAVPVLKLDDSSLSPPSDLWHRINDAIGMAAPFTAGE
jgi:para-aminobenzoate synthetase component 1